MLAGMPVLANLPFRSRPGVTMVDLIGSSMLKPVGHLAESRASCCTFLALRGFAALDDPVVGAADTLFDQLFGPQTLNHQSSPYSSSTLRMARRKSSASAMLSSTSAVPPGGSIMAAATSQLAMMLYCGLVLVCIR
jgi:hypothetical protein